MSDIIKIRDASTVTPTEMEDGELGIDDVNHILYTQTNRGAIALPLDRMALEPFDENASNDVYVFRDTGIAERSDLQGGGGGLERDDRDYRVYGMAPVSISSDALPHQGLIEVNTPTAITGYQVTVVSGSGTVDVKVYRWVDEATEELLSDDTISVSGAGSFTQDVDIHLDPGRYAVVTTGIGITLETLVGYLPWYNDVSNCISMTET